MRTTLDLFGKVEIEIDYHFSIEPAGYGAHNIVFQVVINHPGYNSTNVFKARSTDTELVDQVRDMVVDGCTSDEKQLFIADRWLDRFTSNENVLIWAEEEVYEHNPDLIHG